MLWKRHFVEDELEATTQAGAIFDSDGHHRNWFGDRRSGPGWRSHLGASQWQLYLYEVQASGHEAQN